jgi:hypothetical protein
MQTPGNINRHTVILWMTRGLAWLLALLACGVVPAGGTP